MKKKNLFIMIIGLAFLISSCEKTVDTGVSLTIKATTVTAKSTTGAITFSEATLGIEKIELKMEEEEFDGDVTGEMENEDMEFDFEGPFIVDLLLGTSDPDLSSVAFEPGVYNKFEAKISNVIDDTHSIIIKGMYSALDGTDYGFIFKSDDEIEFKIESDLGFTVTEGSMLDLVVNFDLPALFSQINLENAVINADNMILLDNDNNSEIANQIESLLDDVAEMEEEDEEDDDMDN